MKTIDNTNTVSALKSNGATITTRNNEHHVAFVSEGKSYEIAAKNNKEYSLWRTCPASDYKKEIAASLNPLDLVSCL